MRVSELIHVFRARTETWRMARAGRQSRRKWRVQPQVAAEVLESRAMLSASVSSLYLVNDTGTAGDNVTSDAAVAGTVSEMSAEVDAVELDFDGDGIPETETFVNRDGSFAYDSVPDLPSGSVTIRARVRSHMPDGMSAYSGWTSVTFTYNRPPEITDFWAVEGANGVWTFHGTVDDENLLSLTITFGGLLEGHQVIVDPDGTFTYSVILDEGASGLVTAETTDEYGEDSETAETWL